MIDDHPRRWNAPGHGGEGGLLRILSALGHGIPARTRATLAAIGETFRCDRVVLAECGRRSLTVTQSYHAPSAPAASHAASAHGGPDRSASAPAASNPAALNPAALNPAVSNPAVSNPIVSDPAALDPIVSDPAASNSIGSARSASTQGDEWPIGRTIALALDTGTTMAVPAARAEDLPPAERDRVGSAAVFLPLREDAEMPGHLLILLRDPDDPFTSAEIELLTAVAVRMYFTLEALERNAALERLATAGPGLARHTDLDAMLSEAVVLFREITGTDSAFVVTIDDGIFNLVSYDGVDESIPRRWPRTTETMPNWDRLSAGRPYVGLRQRIPARPHETDASPIVLCVPIVRDGVTVALLGATGHRARSFGKTGIDVAVIMANYLSVAMTNAALYRALTEREQELRHRATHDPLTGLANRTEATQRIAEALRASPTGAVGLMFCDIDKFKAVNDRLGHEAGDELIQQVALRMAAAIRPEDLLARFGGDEFVFLIDGVWDLADLTEAGRRVQQCLADPILLRGERVAVSASIGAVLGRTGTTPSVMLRSADAAMYAAKAKGTGRLEVFDDAAAHDVVDRLDLRSELGHALDRGQLSVVYQPIVSLRDRTITSFEALARWTHPVRGPVPPDVFIPMAEETGDIVDIGAYVLADACGKFAGWCDEFPGIPLSIGANVSAAQLEPGRPDLGDVIRSAGADPHDVWLEVTERMDIRGDITAQVDALRAAGCHFSLDDFGMSYSSLTYLQQFPVEGIKIDKTFVQPMTEGETPLGIVRAILALGESLSVKVIAEGIETPQQLKALVDLGCKYGQGYLLAAPLTADECLTALRSQLTTP